MGSAHAAPALPGGDGPEPVLRLLGVELNGIDQKRVITVRDFGGVLAISREDAEVLRLSLPADAGAKDHGDDFVSLAALPGISAAVDDARQVLQITAVSEAFTGSHLENEDGPVARSKPQTAGFINYDLLAQAQSSSSTLTKTIGGNFETGITGELGVADNTMTVAPGRHGFTRLETSYTDDMPETMNRLTLGDAVSRAGADGAPLRFAGFQYGREFTLQPGFVAFPVPTLQGRASLPSTVQVYVDDALRYQSSVPPGPFDIDRLPTVTGAGQTTLVVRDPLGREEVTQASFYTTPALLREGLWDYSTAGGLQRRNFGVSNADYRTPFSTGLVRYGMTNAVTGEVEVDASQPAQATTGDIAFAVPGLGQAQVGGAVSHGSSGRNGALASVGIARIGPELSFSIDGRHAFGGYTQFGDDPQLQRGLWEADASAGISLGKAGSLTAGFTESLQTGQHATNIASLTYGVQVVDAGYLTMGVASIGATMRSTTLSINFTIPLGSDAIGGLSAESRGGHVTTQASYTSRPEIQRGFGESLTGGEGRYAVDDGTVTWDGSAGSALAEATHTALGNGLRAGYSGGIAIMNDDAYAARKLDQSFALVSVPDHPDVRVYRDNLEIGRTDDSGYALVSDLQPYQSNRLKLEIADIPVSTSITGESLDVVPGFHGAVAAPFAVRTASTIIVKLRLADGQAVPAGADISASGLPPDTFVGFDGEAFLLGLASGDKIHVAWNGRSCDAKVPAGADREGTALSTVQTISCLEAAA